jgi:UDP-3-O-[3-hydroxymyristoyl] glucosamine N-acyltransferase
VARGVKVDNLVQIGHASSVGENTLLCAQVGLAGSTKVGRDVILADRSARPAISPSVIGPS